MLRNIVGVVFKNMQTKHILITRLGFTKILGQYVFQGSAITMKLRYVITYVRQ